MDEMVEKKMGDL